MKTTHNLPQHVSAHPSYSRPTRPPLGVTYDRTMTFKQYTYNLNTKANLYWISSEHSDNPKRTSPWHTSSTSGLFYHTSTQHSNQPQQYCISKSFKLPRRASFDSPLAASNHNHTTPAPKSTGPLVNQYMRMRGTHKLLINRLLNSHSPRPPKCTPTTHYSS